MTDNQFTLVNYVGITGRKGAVWGRVFHPPRVGDHLRWMKFSKGDARCSVSYYEVVGVQWDVRDARHYYLYRPGDEGECYVTVFVEPVRRSPGEIFDGAERAAHRARERRRRKQGRGEAAVTGG